jgi:hypothetical protein
MTGTSDAALSEDAAPLDAEDQEHAAEIARRQRFVPRLIRRGEVTSRLLGTGPIGRANAWLAVRITRIVGTMYCAYLFAVIALVALPSAIQQGSPTVLVNWVSANFLQLVLLPIIIVGQNVISAAQDSRAEADHETLVTLHEMNLRQLQILAHQNRILKLLRKRSRFEGGSDPGHAVPTAGRAED